MEQQNRYGKVTVVMVVASVLVAFVAGLGVMHFLNGFAYVTTDDAYVDGRIHQVAPKVAGTVKDVLADDNQAVKAGDLLVRIDPQDYEAKMREADGAYLAERARYHEAIAKIAAAQTNLEVQGTNLHQAELDLHRAERLFAQGALSKERLEKAQTGSALARSQLKAAREQVLQAKATKEIEASLIQQRAGALKTATLNLSYTDILSPSDGSVTKRSVESGNQVQAGQPLMAVVALHDVWVVANFKETQLKSIRPGQEVDIKVDTFADHVFKGYVDSVMAGTGAAFSLFPPENALGNYVKIVQRIPVKIVLEDAAGKEHQLRIGMSVVARVKVK